MRLTTCQKMRAPISVTLKKKLQVPVGIISVGPQRGEELILSPLFED